MIELSGIQITYLEGVLASSVFFLSILIFVSLRKIQALDARLAQVQLTTTREIKMVNQGAIGIGRRFAQIEKNLKKNKNVASFAVAKEAKKQPSQFRQVEQEVTETKVQPKVQQPGLSTRAEQALSAWINENRTA